MVGNAISNPSLIRVHREILTSQTAADDFGYRLGRRFVVFQVTIENGSPDHQFMLQDVSVDFSSYFPTVPRGTYQYSASGQDLTMLRGVPEKGQDLDPRNRWLHVLQGIGSVAGAISGITEFADTMGPAIAIFNGSFLQGYTTIAPDHTATQLNRLSDSAFIANTVIDKQRAKTIAIFIPADELLSKGEQSSFRKNPYTYMGFGPDKYFNQADICVDGTFIQAVNAVAPILASVAFGQGSLTLPNTPAVLTVSGSNLATGDTLVVVSGATPSTAPLIVNVDGTTGTAQVQLPGDFNPSSSTVTLQSKSNSSLVSGPGTKITEAAPTLLTAVLRKQPAPLAGNDAILDVTGADLVFNDTMVILSGAPLPPATVTVSIDGTLGKAMVTLPATYVAGQTTATLQSKSTPTAKSAAVPVTVAP